MKRPAPGNKTEEYISNSDSESGYSSSEEELSIYTSSEEEFSVSQISDLLSPVTDEDNDFVIINNNATSTIIPDPFVAAPLDNDFNKRVEAVTNATSAPVNHSLTERIQALRQTYVGNETKGAEFLKTNSVFGQAKHNLAELLQNQQQQNQQEQQSSYQKKN